MVVFPVVIFFFKKKKFYFQFRQDIKDCREINASWTKTHVRGKRIRTKG